MKLKIQASQVVHYDQEIEITAKQAEKITRDINWEDKDGELTNWLDLRDVVDSGDFDLDCLQILNNDGKVVKTII